MVIDESYNCSRHEEAALNSRHQEGVGVDEFFSRREFLDQRSDSWPEHPETGGYQCVHGVDFPDFDPVGECEYCNHQNDYGTDGVEHHDQAAPVFAVDDYASEWEQ